MFILSYNCAAPRRLPFSDCSGLPEYVLSIEGVVIGSRIDSTSRDAREATLEAFVLRARASDYVNIVDADQVSYRMNPAKKLDLFVDHDAAVKGAFRYDLLCGERHVLPDRIPACEYCRESGHIQHFCQTLREVKDLVDMEKTKLIHSSISREDLLPKSLPDRIGRSTLASLSTVPSANNVAFPLGPPSEFTSLAPRTNVLSDFKVLSEHIIRGNTTNGSIPPSKYPPRLMGICLPSSQTETSSAHPVRSQSLIRDSYCSGNPITAGSPSVCSLPHPTLVRNVSSACSGPVSTPFFNISVPPPILPDMRSPPPILPRATLPPCLPPQNQPPPAIPYSTVFPADGQKKPLSSLSGNFQISSRSDLGQEVLSKEEKLKLKVIQSNLRDQERRKANDVSKSIRKCNPPKSKNLISLV